MHPEQNWFHRHVTFEQDQRYRNLLDRHRITLAWIQELELDRPAKLIGKEGSSGSAPLGAELRAMVRYLESVSPASRLEDLLDDTTPDDVLQRLEHAILALQSWVLQKILGQTGLRDLPTIRNRLEQAAWRAGRDCAHERWPALPAWEQNDLRALFSAFQDNPIYGNWGDGGILLRRAVSKEILFETRRCPHALAHPELQGSAQDLCDLYGHWSRGFAYSLNPRVVLDTSRESHCLQSWKLP